MPYRLATSQYIKRRAAWTHRRLYHGTNYFATIFFAASGDFIDKKRLKFPLDFAIMPLCDSTQGSYIGNTTASQAVKAGSIPVPCSKKGSTLLGASFFAGSGIEPISMRQPGGLSLAAGLTAATQLFSSQREENTNRFEVPCSTILKGTPLRVPFCLLIIHHADPGEQELMLLGVALCQLGGGHNGHPLLHILLGAGVGADDHAVAGLQGQQGLKNSGRGGVGGITAPMTPTGSAIL